MFRIFKSKEYRNKFLSLMLPIALQEVIVILASTVGVLLLGIVDAIAMSGVSIANNVFFVFNSVISGLIVAGNLLAAQYYGKKDIKNVNQVFNLSLKLSLIISVIFFLLSEIIPTQLVGLFAPGEEAIINCGTNYLRVFAISFFFRGISGIYMYILKNLNKTKEIIKITLITLLFNIGLCSILLFASHLNELAPAISIVVARIIEVILAIYFVNKYKTAKFTFKNFLHTDKIIFNKFFNHLIPLLITKMAWSLGSVMISYFLGKLGSDIISANSLWSITRNVCICFSSGAGGATAILIGQECGANKLKEAKEHGEEIFKFAPIVGILGMLLYLGMCGVCYLIGLNELTQGAKQYLIYMSLIYAPTFIFQAYNAIILDGHCSAGGDTKFFALANGLPYWIVVVPFGFISTSLNWPPLLIFFLVTSEEIVKNLPIMIRYKQYKWVRNITNESK